MNQKLKLALTMLVVVAVFAGVYGLYDRLGAQVAPAQPGAEAEGGQTEVSPAPDFTAINEAGETVSLSDYRGKPVVLNFWASWCGPCRSEMPEFQRAYEQYGDDVHFLMVNLTDNSRETVEAAKEFVGESGYSFPLLFDTEGKAAAAYGVMSIPSTYFIDAQGGAVARAAGALSMEMLEQGIGLVHGG